MDLSFLGDIINVAAGTNPVVQIMTLASTVIGGASLIVKGVGAIAKITPTTKDDEFAGKAAQYLGVLISFLDYLALNPDQDQARRPKRLRNLK